MPLLPKLIMSNGFKPYFLAFIGVLIFSATLPATKIAVQELSPLFVFSARTIIASLLAIFWLINNKGAFAQAKPLRKEILISMLGTVIGFPLLTSYALLYTGASHGALVGSLVPIITAVLSSWIFKSSRGILFWLLALCATVIVTSTVILQNKIIWELADTLLIFSSIVVAVGYVYGAKVSKIVGGVATISLSLLASLPFVIPIFIYSIPRKITELKTTLALLYLGLFSMFIGFVFWYKGLAEGKTEKVSLVQLLQLFLTYFFSSILLKENISPSMIWSALLVVGCLAGTKLAR